MKRLLVVILALMMIIAAVGCGSTQSANENSTEGGAPSQGVEDKADDGGLAPVYYGDSEESAGEGGADVDQSPGTAIPDGGFILNPEQKIIYNGEISIETEKFNDTMAKIDAKIRETGSYIESSGISGTGRDEYDLRNASLVIRVPAAKFDYLKKAAEDWGSVIRANTSSQDVTRQYVDTEARVKTLKTQEERLLLLLGKAEKLEDIIILEGRLSDIRLQIESYTSSLLALDSLVDYATIVVTVREVKSETFVPQNFGEKLLESIKDSISQFGRFLESGLLAIIYLLPYAVILVIAIAVFKKTSLAGKLGTVRPFKRKAKNQDDSNTLNKS